MQVTFSSDEPVDQVLRVVGAVYGVSVRTDDDPSAALDDIDYDTGLSKPRH
ncbi:hypothetical protein Q9R32_09475 [Actinotalea sp. AC32]|nr:hypothetical protein [Actinotalea sp. AC32]